MSIHVCKQCGSRFEYCRQCVFRPVRYKDAGFCSKECYEASKNVIVEPDEVVLVEESKPIVEDIKAIEEEVETEVVTLVETPTIETITPIIKKETYNTYKKKKNKYKVHE